MNYKKKYLKYKIKYEKIKHIGGGKYIPPHLRNQGNTTNSTQSVEQAEKLRLIMEEEKKDEERLKKKSILQSNKLELKDSNFNIEQNSIDIINPELFNDTIFVILPSEIEQNEKIIEFMIKLLNNLNILYFSSTISRMHFSQDYFTVVKISNDYKIFYYEGYALKKNHFTDFIDKINGLQLFNSPELRLEFIHDNRIQSYMRQKCDMHKAPEIKTELNKIKINLEKGGNIVGIPSDHIHSRKKAISLSFNYNNYNKKDYDCQEKDYIIYLHRYVNKIYGHIDEILCFMPYGKNKSKIWFYYPVFNDDFNKDEVEHFWILNYNILLKYFNFNDIILIPTLFEGGKISIPPYFNRTILKKNDTYHIIFPYDTIDIKNEIDIMTQKCNLENINVEIYSIDTTKTHSVSNDGEIGGNMHCMFKTI